MTNYDVAKEYSNCVLNKFENLIPILYGSSVFGINGHDLDICFISDKELLKEELKELINITRFYHNKYKLIVDEEVPYANKLIYPKEFINDTFINGPFPIIDEKYQIPQIVKTREFLSSINMRKRLLLNILTTKHLVLHDNQEGIENYSKKAYEYMINVLISYANLNSFTEEELYKVFVKDPYSKVDGELYLGYKTNFKERVVYLKSRINMCLNEMLEKEEIILNKDGQYVKKR